MVRVRTILSFCYRASTLLRLQDFDIRLENKPRVGTPICRNFIKGTSLVPGGKSIMPELSVSEKANSVLVEKYNIEEQTLKPP